MGRAQWIPRGIEQGIFPCSAQYLLGVQVVDVGPCNQLAEKGDAAHPCSSGFCSQYFSGNVLGVILGFEGVV